MHFLHHVAPGGLSPSPLPHCPLFSFFCGMSVFRGQWSVLPPKAVGSGQGLACLFFFRKFHSCPKRSQFSDPTSLYVEARGCPPPQHPLQSPPLHLLHPQHQPLVCSKRMIGLNVEYLCATPVSTSSLRLFECPEPQQDVCSLFPHLTILQSPRHPAHLRLPPQAPPVHQHPPHH